MKTRRQYVMKARAEGAEDTRRRILAATIDLHYERLGRDITLEQIAERASVAVQTVLRNFGSRAALLDAAVQAAVAVVVEERRATPGDVNAAVTALFDHYERVGRNVLRLLAQETISGAPNLSAGRTLHRQWVEGVFAPQLAGHPQEARESLTDRLVVVTDVYAWKLLRVDRGLSRRQAQNRVRQMIAAMVALHQEEPHV
ncbi:MAG: TetR/AcrR family transcriptional regulator [Candidatus Dormibacteraeota bacterium]|nr:TetR/AcrR family transcriptional regulator [Candidatus Dormibacteraeota bacterium]